jgi:hypothetical protein
MEDLIKIVAGDTDSLYISFEGLLNTIEGIEDMSSEQIRDILVELNTGFLDEHNNEFMKEYYATRNSQCVHKFELETVAKSECRLNVKKRYGQLLIWKDGKSYEDGNLPLKIKGLEIAKSSYPKQAREALKRLVRYLLEDEGDGYLLQRLNMRMMEEKKKFFEADIEDICGNVGVQNYTKYIISDTNPDELIVAPKIPYNVRALGTYNWIRNKYNLPGDPLYGGKMKWYCFYPPNVPLGKKSEPSYFAFQSRNYPEWANKYAPISRSIMFEKMVLDPFNRIIESVGIGSLRPDGAIQMSLF